MTPLTIALIVVGACAVIILGLLYLALHSPRVDHDGEHFTDIGIGGGASGGRAK